MKQAINENALVKHANPADISRGKYGILGSVCRIGARR